MRVWLLPLLLVLVVAAAPARAHAQAASDQGEDDPAPAPNVANDATPEGQAPPERPSASAIGAHIAVLSMGGDAPEAPARRAREEVTAALTEDGMRVLSDADVDMRIAPSRRASCHGAQCAHEIALDLGVGMLAMVAVWMQNDAPDSLVVSLVMGPDRSHSATEHIGEGGLEAAARAAVDAIQASRRRALIIEGHTSPPAPSTDQAPAPEPAPTQGALQAERSLEEWILPSLLGVVGLGLIGTSVYALMEEQCDLRGPSGVCLRGDSPNIGLGVTFVVAGGLAIAGAITWLVLGGQPPSVGNVDVVLGPDGGVVSWRRAF